MAVIGASDDPDKVGGRPIDYLRRFGFGGAVYPVNPRRSLVQGLPSYPDLAALPEPPDAAVVVVPGPAAVEAVERCAERGVRAAVVMASGFGEASAEGRRAQDRMVATARAAGMRLVGPNCQGITNFATGAVLSFSTMFLEVPPADGPVAIASQSGSMSQVPYAALRKRGLGVRYSAATGNDADVSALEVATAMAQDPGVGLLLLYLETIREADWLAELGRLAGRRDLPVVALKAGTTPAGQAAAASHTGALANEDRVVSAFLERVGIHRAADLPDLLVAAELHLRDDWRPSGGGVAVVSNSGASCVQTADAVAGQGLNLAELGPETVSKIAAVLPSFATPANPVDVTAALLGNSRLLSQVLPALAGDPGVGSLVVALPVAGQGYDVGALAADTAAYADGGRPTVVVSAHAPVADAFRAVGLPVHATEVEAVAALAQWVRRPRPVASGSRPVLGGRSVPPAPPVMLDEAASLSVLAAAGVPVVDHRLCADAESAVEARSILGGRIALKGCTERVGHKSDLGLVVLDLATDDQVRAGFMVVSERLRALDPDAPGVLVERLVDRGHELMIGARIDPVFGPLVVIGAGGAYVDVLPDVQLLLPPFGVDEVIAALGRLRVAPVLAGVRGSPPADLGALAAAAVAVGELISDPGSAVVEVDVNPVIVGARGTGCTAVDGLVLVSRG